MTLNVLGTTLGRLIRRWRLIVIIVDWWRSSIVTIIFVWSVVGRHWDMVCGIILGALTTSYKPSVIGERRKALLHSALHVYVCEHKIEKSHGHNGAENSPSDDLAFSRPPKWHNFNLIFSIIIAIVTGHHLSREQGYSFHP